MNLGHVIYKVENLDKVVKEFQSLGFQIEYGSKKKPYNALVYFSDGAYIELMAKTGMPKLVKQLFLVIGKKLFKE